MDADSKKIILHLILDNKSILFGKFGNTVTPDMKIAKWKEITAKIQSLGIFSKDWKYLRDTTWQNWRKRTVEKRDNRILIGDTTGKRFKYDESDKIVMSILENDGLTTPGADTPSFDEVLLVKPDIDDYLSVNESSDKRKSTEQSQSQHTPLSLNYETSQSQRSLLSLNYFRKEKLKVETMLLKEKIQIAQREKRKLDLEIMKLELELQVSKKSRISDNGDG